ncbi:MAG TPA: shikimate dehydrogenase [Bryobacteraceae bacterium]|nr:shikimate dehydrogenase [Bryobacteraceae bacterium]
MPLKPALPRICIALGLPTADKLLDQARREVEAGEGFFEFRLDYLPKPEQGAAVISDLLAEFPGCLILATCRRHQNQGRFNGSIEEQIRVLELAVDQGAKAVDIEVESAAAPGIRGRLDSLRNRAKLIVSYHNFESTPALDAILRRLVQVPADAYKIVTTARKQSDNSRVLSLAATHPKTPLILLAMGETGFPTRVLSPLHGGLYTYAAPNTQDGTASGQCSSRAMRSLYRVEKLTKTARVYGVIADPVRHSLSPAIHNRALQARRIDAVYLPFLVSATGLKDFFVFADSLPVAGFSVTIPHKTRVMRYLDVVEPLARRIGAVNTVWRKAGKWRGANTDVRGVTVPLGRRMRLAKASVLLVGNGGAARGAAWALAEAGAKLSVTGRNPDRVRAFARMCGGEGLTPEQAERGHFDAVVHATPLGMFPKVDECFFRDRVPGDVVMDMVYNPAETLLLRRAVEQGHETVPGTEMFLEQAVAQFELWTGESAPRSAMEKALAEALANHH